LVSATPRRRLKYHSLHYKQAPQVLFQRQHAPRRDIAIAGSSFIFSRVLEKGFVRPAARAFESKSGRPNSAASRDPAQPFQNNTMPGKAFTARSTALMLAVAVLFFTAAIAADAAEALPAASGTPLSPFRLRRLLALGAGRHLMGSCGGGGGGGGGAGKGGSGGGAKGGGGGGAKSSGGGGRSGGGNRGGDGTAVSSGFSGKGDAAASVRRGWNSFGKMLNAGRRLFHSCG
jgi:hypothetical protein